jgi:ankyrin repeat protein
MLLSLSQNLTYDKVENLFSKALNLSQDASALGLLNRLVSGSQNHPRAYLTLAIQHGRIVVVRSLVLDYGVQPDERDENLWTALIAAAEFGQEEITKFLVETGKFNI